MDTTTFSININDSHNMMNGLGPVSPSVQKISLTNTFNHDMVS